LALASIEEELPGYPLYIKKIENRMRRLLKIAKLNPELTPHLLRHTHTSLLAQAGVSLPQIKERLGHKGEDTTKNVYLHVTKEMKKEASQKFKELMRSLNFNGRVSRIPYYRQCNAGITSCRPFIFIYN
jgi:integrase